MNVRLALDAMGGDFAPSAAVEGAVRHARAHPDHAVVLVGDTGSVRPLLARLHAPSNLILHHAAETVGMDDEPSQAIRRKKDSSLRVGLELVRAGEADAFVSAGHSGAVLAGALLVLGRLEGAERPAIAALLPALKKGRCLLLDAGANVECRPRQLAQWAVMGEAYVRTVMHVPKPRVAVLSNGEEASKGTALTREAAEFLRAGREAGGLDFRGYVEGKDIFSGAVEVVVTDGFTGNVVLKTAEGTALGVVGLIKQAIEKSPLPERIGALLMKPTLMGLRKVVDWAEYGGAPLLGVNGVVLVAHGRSDARAVENALRAACTTVELGLLPALEDALRRAASWIPGRDGRPVSD